MSCGTQAQEFHPGDPDGAWLLRSFLWISHLPAGTAYRTPLPDFPVRASAADAFTGVLLTCFAAARQFIPARPYCLSGLREKIYPGKGSMSTPATIDFWMSEAEVTCCESGGRHPLR
jgi:hypothetical protein